MKYGAIRKESTFMRRLLFVPLPAVALVVAFGISVVGQGHAQSTVRHMTQGSAITQSWTFSGPVEAVSTNGQLEFIDTVQDKLADGSTASESDAGTTYTPGANGCVGETTQGTRTFASPADTYDLVAVAEVCPAAGKTGQTITSGHAVISGGTGRYKGASGTGPYTVACALVPPKAGQPLIFNCNGQGSLMITLAGQ
jgi:hypothetical protein